MIRQLGSKAVANRDFVRQSFDRPCCNINSLSQNRQRIPAGRLTGRRKNFVTL
jgi:hypothetical protein